MAQILDEENEFIAEEPEVFTESQSLDTYLNETKPSVEELKRRYIRSHFVKFVGQYYRDGKKLCPNPIGSEEHFFDNYPESEKIWIARRKHIVSVMPSDQTLVNRWKQRRIYYFKWCNKRTTVPIMFGWKTGCDVIESLQRYIVSNKTKVISYFVVIALLLLCLSFYFRHNSDKSCSR